MEIDTLIVYLLYLKKTGKLYAFTTEKSIKKSFLEERNEKCFYTEKVEMDEFEFSIFANNNRGLKLEQIPIDVSLNKSVLIYATESEEADIENFHSNIIWHMEDIWRELNAQYKSPFKKKYRDAIVFLCKTDRDYTYPDGSKGSMSTANIVYLYMKLFKDTYFENYEEENDDESSN